MNETIASVTDAQWWLEPENRAHLRVTAVVQEIRQNQEYRKVDDLLNASLYGNLPVIGFGYGSFARKPLATERLSLNVVRNMVGAVTSKIASKNKPKPTFLTEGGNYDLAEKAQKLEKFVGGVFYESGVYAQLANCFRDACVYGTGCLKIWDCDGRVDVERVIPWEIVVDDGESLYGQPRNLYQRKYVDRLVLRATWAKGDRQAEVEAALASPSTPDPQDAEYAYRTTADQVLVTEAWHLGENDKTKGRHVICIDGCTLLDEEWDGPFPFAFMRWSSPLVGFFGVGLAEELRGIQREINKLLQQIQRGHHLIAGHWLVEQGSKVNTSMLNNDLAAIVKWAGTRPEYQAPAIIAPEVYAHLWQLYSKAFEIAGISQLNASGTKPAGLDSGEAQRVYQDIQTERFLEVGQAYEEFVVEAARQVVRCAKRIGGSYKVRAVDKSSIEIIDWADIDIKEDLYVIQVFPTSMLPSTPAGRIAWAQDMIESGMMPPEDVLEVIDYPDTEAYKKRRLAPRKIIERNVAHMLKTGEFVSPEPFDDHQTALRLVNESYHEARLDGVDEDRLELLRRYMTDTQDFMAAPPPAAPMPPMTPPGVPGLPPMPGEMAPPMPPPMPPMPPGPPLPMAA